MDNYLAQDARLSVLACSVKTLGPGVLLAFTIASAASFLAENYHAPVMLFALLIGMAFYYLSESDQCKAGVNFTASTLLRIGVALLGVRVTLEQIMSMGTAPLVMVPTLVLLTIGSGVIFSRMFGRSWRLGLLTGGAVAICGASAALAIAAVLQTRDKECDTLFTVIAVTTLSTVAMVAYPIIYSALGFDHTQVGILLGATIHDVAQVVGAGYAVSDQTGDVGTYVKLLRVAMLPIVVMVIAITQKSENAAEKAAFPWFAIAFAIILMANSAGVIPEIVRAQLESISRWLLIAAISALGVKTSIGAMMALGPQHIFVVVAETVFLLVIALVAVSLL